ncbi:hypothetical protein C8N46_1178 [Kordia periserrulae]|uniref:Uncharacterized protein n=1 Tax=Kordia periserrulae TaxID=701523 RepID=A0A2T6BQB7_9FLAO|nr:hypothetical protein C8N46_1178 [Kordia periserrulae]
MQKLNTHFIKGFLIGFLSASILFALIVLIGICFFYLLKLQLKILLLVVAFCCKLLMLLKNTYYIKKKSDIFMPL